jgi:hypothetical protein
MTLAFALVKLLLIIKIIEPLAFANGPVTLWQMPYALHAFTAIIAIKIITTTISSKYS